MGDSSFLSQFLMITDIKTIIFIAVLIGTFFIVKQFEKKKVKFSTRTIYATIIGLILGVIIQFVAGLPGTATMAVSVVLSGVGLGSYFPLAGGILAIDPILDMGRTMLNVNGATTTAVTVGKSLKKLDKEVFNSATPLQGKEESA